MKDYGKRIQWPLPPEILKNFVEALKKSHQRLFLQISALRHFTVALQVNIELATEIQG